MPVQIQMKLIKEFLTLISMKTDIIMNKVDLPQNYIGSPEVFGLVFLKRSRYQSIRRGSPPSPGQPDNRIIVTNLLDSRAGAFVKGGDAFPGNQFTDATNGITGAVTYNGSMVGLHGLERENQPPQFSKMGGDDTLMVDFGSTRSTVGEIALTIDSLTFDGFDKTGEISSSFNMPSTIPGFGASSSNENSYLASGSNQNLGTIDGKSYRGNWNLGFYGPHESPGADSLYPSQAGGTINGSSTDGKARFLGSFATSVEEILVPLAPLRDRPPSASYVDFDSNLRNPKVRQLQVRYPTSLGQRLTQDTTTTIPSNYGWTGKRFTLDVSRRWDNELPNGKPEAVAYFNVEPSAEFDDNYASYGWWLFTSEDNPRNTNFASAFAGEWGTGITVARNVNAWTGTVTYRGAAAGQYALRGSTSANPNDAGSFTARATLVADFGNNTAPGTVSGTINNFVAADGRALNWSVQLQQSNIHPTNLPGSIPERGGTEQQTVWTMGGTAAPAAGRWNGRLLDQPTGANIPKTVIGKFYSEYNTYGKMVGGFGANR